MANHCQHFWLHSKAGTTDGLHILDSVPNDSSSWNTISASNYAVSARFRCHSLCADTGCLHEPISCNIAPTCAPFVQAAPRLLARRPLLGPTREAIRAIVCPRGRLHHCCFVGAPALLMCAAPLHFLLRPRRRPSAVVLLTISGVRGSRRGFSCSRGCPRASLVQFEATPLTLLR